jgi:hypothetical protein
MKPFTLFARVLFPAMSWADTIDTVTLAVPGDDLAFQFTISSTLPTLPALEMVTVSGVENETTPLAVGISTNFIAIDCINIYHCPVGRDGQFLHVETSVPIINRGTLIPGSYSSVFPHKIRNQDGRYAAFRTP